MTDFLSKNTFGSPYVSFDNDDIPEDSFSNNPFNGMVDRDDNDGDTEFTLEGMDELFTNEKSQLDLSDGESVHVISSEDEGYEAEEEDTNSRAQDLFNQSGDVTEQTNTGELTVYDDSHVEPLSLSGDEDDDATDDESTEDVDKLKELLRQAQDSIGSLQSQLSKAEHKVEELEEMNEELQESNEELKESHQNKEQELLRTINALKTRSPKRKREDTEGDNERPTTRRRTGKHLRYDDYGEVQEGGNWIMDEEENLIWYPPYGKSHDGLFYCHDPQCMRSFKGAHALKMHVFAEGVHNGDLLNGRSGHGIEIGEQPELRERDGREFIPEGWDPYCYCTECDHKEVARTNLKRHFTRNHIHVPEHLSSNDLISQYITGEINRRLPAKKQGNYKSRPKSPVQYVRKVGENGMAI